MRRRLQPLSIPTWRFTIAGGKTPTQARLPLGDQLIAASVSYDQKRLRLRKFPPTQCKFGRVADPDATLRAGSACIIQSDRETGLAPPRDTLFSNCFVRLMPNETINTFQRWHVLNLSAQAAILK
jgi:hypothetical protein